MSCSAQTVSRRTVLIGSFGAFALQPGAAAHGAGLDIEEWQAFKSKYVTADGRIVDNVNGGISHSEGQGWGLLFAEAFNDAVGFDHILGWTQQALRRPTDALHAWRYLPGHHPPVPDMNNATDGGIFIAAALARASRRWANPDHLRAASAIAHDILQMDEEAAAGLAELSGVAMVSTLRSLKSCRLSDSPEVFFRASSPRWLLRYCTTAPEDSR